jgi:hypothetical protein
MDFTRTSHYPETSERKSLSAFNTPPFHNVFTAAVKFSRSEIADKIMENRLEAYVLEDGVSVISVEDAVNLELRQLVGNDTFSSYEDPFREYITLVRNSADNEDLGVGERRGIWGSEIEIQAACALYYIDIRRFGIDSSGKLESDDGMYYRAIDVRERFVKGKSYSSSLQGVITICWASYGENSAHYLSTRPLESELPLVISPDGTVKRHIPDQQTLLVIGTDFQFDSGHFHPLSEKDVHSSVENKVDRGVSFWYRDSDVYYLGKKIGIRSESAVGIVFEQ